MDESVFGAGFDLQDYIHKRSLDIQDLRERARIGRSPTP